jgi:hypothetical protein
MTEAEARALLRDWPGVGGLEGWIAARRWKAAPGGWTVSGELQGWQFRIDVIPAGLQISASVPGGDPAVWVITRPVQMFGGTGRDEERSHGSDQMAAAR